MKFRNLAFLAITGMALLISIIVGRASEPMSEEEIKRLFFSHWH
jgi:hypothetical protein